MSVISQLTMDLAMLDIKTSALALLTGEPKPVIQKIRNSLNVASKKGGEDPTIARTTQTHARLLGATYFLSLYIQLADDPLHTIDQQAFYTALKTYDAAFLSWYEGEMNPTAYVTAEGCLLLARSYRSREIWIETCSSCGITLVTGEQVHGNSPSSGRPCCNISKRPQMSVKDLMPGHTKNAVEISTHGRGSFHAVSPHLFPENVAESS